MHSYSLKTTISASPKQVFAAITDPKWIVKWDSSNWVLNDMRTGGKLKKRDEEGRAMVGEIVAYDAPWRFILLWPVPVNPDEPEEATFIVRMEFWIEAAGNQSVLNLSATGFETEELANREKNSWGGFYLEKIKKVAEQIPLAELKMLGHEDTIYGNDFPGQVRGTEIATVNR